MLSVGAAESGPSADAAATASQAAPASPTAAAAAAAAKLRAHLAQDSAWRVLLAGLLGLSNDATMIECSAEALAAIGRDAAAARSLLTLDDQKHEYMLSDEEKQRRKELGELLCSACAVPRQPVKHKVWGALRTL